MKYELIQTRTVPTVQFEQNGYIRVFHSKYDPLKEAKAWADKMSQQVRRGLPIFVFGLAAGYHAKCLAEKLPTEQIVLVELNAAYKEWFETTFFYQELQQAANITFLALTDVAQIIEESPQENILLQKTAMYLIPEQYHAVKELLEHIYIQKESIAKQVAKMEKNFWDNIKRKDPGIAHLKNQYQKKMILVSAGPSLDKQLPLLKEIRHQTDIVIASVGTAVKPLLSAGVVPDFFMIIDANEPTLHQLTDISLPETPLLYLSTAYSNTIQLHQGPSYIVFQRGFPEAEQQAQKQNEPVIKTGGSVATALLDTMVYLGGTQIALVGQDLAYTHGQTHSSYAVANQSVSGARVKTVSYDQQGEVDTSKNLTIYRKWFEAYAKEKESGLCLYNCTEGGAYIEGWEHVGLKGFLSEDD